MLNDTSESRQASYTTPRPDVFEMVPSSAMAILDVGCSNGALGASLRHARSGREVIGLEGDAAFVRDAGNCLDQVLHVDLNSFDWSKAFPNQRFDCIIFADILEHLIDPRRHLVQAQRCLRSGGCCIVSLPNIRHISSLFSIFIRGTFPQRERGIFDKTHLRWFTLRDAEAMLNDAGMNIEAMTCSLRLGDRGGGRLNKIAGWLFDPIQQFFPIREFLTYQFCLRAVRRQGNEN